MKAGDILCYDRVWNEGINRDPIWVRVKQVTGTNFEGVYLGGGQSVAGGWYSDFTPGVTAWRAGIAPQQRARFRVVTEDEVPEQLWALIAQAALLG